LCEREGFRGENQGDRSRGRSRVESRIEACTESRKLGTCRSFKDHFLSPLSAQFPAASGDCRHPTGRERMYSPTLRTLQDPTLLLPGVWLSRLRLSKRQCFGSQLCHRGVNRACRRAVAAWAADGDAVRRARKLVRQKKHPAQPQRGCATTHCWVCAEAACTGFSPASVGSVGAVSRVRAKSDKHRLTRYH
jgi:hypothetical protein